jgi:hypothetical protein
MSEDSYEKKEFVEKGNVCFETEGFHQTFTFLRDSNMDSEAQTS